MRDSAAFYGPCGTGSRSLQTAAPQAEETADDDDLREEAVSDALTSEEGMRTAKAPAGRVAVLQGGFWGLLGPAAFHSMTSVPLQFSTISAPSAAAIRLALSLTQCGTRHR